MILVQIRSMAGGYGDDEELFHLKTPDILDRLNVFYGNDFAASMIELSEENDYLSIRGFLGKPVMQKRRKLDQYFFINRRLVQNRMLSQAVQQAYGDLLVERQTPFVLLFLGIDPSRVDVNVHPAKLEIRFDDERSVRNMFYPVVKRTIQLQDFSPDIQALENDEFHPSLSGGLIVQKTWVSGYTEPLHFNW